MPIPGDPVDNCGFLPFSVDVRPKHGFLDVAREVAFRKIGVRVESMHLVPDALGLS